jgi:hypothetical protein
LTPEGAERERLLQEAANARNSTDPLVRSVQLAKDATKVAEDALSDAEEAMTNYERVSDLALQAQQDEARDPNNQGLVQARINANGAMFSFQTKMHRAMNLAQSKQIAAAQATMVATLEQRLVNHAGNRREVIDRLQSDVDRINSILLMLADRLIGRTTAR